MTKCITEQLEFPALKRRNISIQFSGGAISGDGGCLLLRLADGLLGLTERISQNLHDPRNPKLCLHSTQNLLQQRVYALALGYADLKTTKICGSTPPCKPP